MEEATREQLGRVLAVLIARYLATGEAHIIGLGRDVTGRWRAGSTFPIGPAISEFNDVSLFTGMIRDISDRRELQNHPTWRDIMHLHLIDGR